jgi:methyl-accepting chemotaxis protein
VQHVASGVSQLSGGLTESEHEMMSISREARHLMELAEESNAIVALKAHDSYHRPFFQLARESADAISHTLDQAIDRGLVGFEQLFDRDYQAIEGTNPQKYTTRWDALCDELLPPIQEPALASRPEVIFVHACDDQGYVPTHNKAFSQALTGDYHHDLKFNRTKRLFNDRTGARAGENVEEMLLQTYKRDTGEVVHDLSVPIYVKGEHWGALRVGYVPEGR